jgi:hypothetical protein
LRKQAKDQHKYYLRPKKIQPLNNTNFKHSQIFDQIYINN